MRRRPGPHIKMAAPRWREGKQEEREEKKRKKKMAVSRVVAQLHAVILHNSRNARGYSRVVLWGVCDTGLLPVRCPQEAAREHGEPLRRVRLSVAGRHKGGTPRRDEFLYIWHFTAQHYTVLYTRVVRVARCSSRFHQVHLNRTSRIRNTVLVAELTGTRPIPTAA